MKIYGRADGESSPKKNNTSSIRKNKITKDAYIDKLKSIEKKVGFAAVFTDFTKTGALPEEAYIHIAIKIVLKEIKKRKNKR